MLVQRNFVCQVTQRAGRGLLCRASGGASAHVNASSCIAFGLHQHCLLCVCVSVQEPFVLADLTMKAVPQACHCPIHISVRDVARMLSTSNYCSPGHGFVGHLGFVAAACQTTACQGNSKLEATFRVCITVAEYNAYDHVLVFPASLPRPRRPQWSWIMTSSTWA